MRILHTSDWHLGRKLYGRNRYREFKEFLDWLLALLKRESIDILVVAGDIFDTGAPGPRVQELYYNFLYQLSQLDLSHTFIVGGNHDSPTLINAPGSLLKTMKISVTGSKGDSLENEVIEVKNRKGDSLGIVCSVPFLRDRDLRRIESGESVEDKEFKFYNGILSHYQEITLRANDLRGDRDIPVIATGHLFMRGGMVSKDDGVRDLYVGTLGQVSSSIIPDFVDYMALGHLHQCQKVDNKEHIRYSGSPIPMGFGEASRDKYVLIGDFNGRDLNINEVQVPAFSNLISVRGSLGDIREEINSLVESRIEAFIEVEYTHDEPVSGLRQLVEELVIDSSIEVLVIKDRSLVRGILNGDPGEELDELTPLEVFNRCIEHYEGSRSRELISMFNEVLDAVNMEDNG